MANQVCSNCNYSHYFPYPQNKIQCQCGNTVSLSSQLSTIEQNEFDVHDIYEMSDKDNFTNDESAENSTTSSYATEQKKNIREKKSFGMKLFLSFGLTIIISIAIQVVNPNWAEGSKTARQAEWGKTFGNSSDIENYLPKKETPVQFALSGLFAVIWLAGVYTIFKDN